MSYSVERNAQVIVSLLKQHRIRYVVASPGTTNIPLVVTFQRDPYFKVFSCVDERSAAYVACGLAATGGEPVVLSCTGATASRDYMPGLTEAYYRKLPVIALTSFNGNRKIGQLVPQNLDRTVIPNDIALKSVQIPVVRDNTDAVYCTRLVNDALLECFRRGGGPVHLNIETSYTPEFVEGKLPVYRKINRYGYEDQFPKLNQKAKIVVFIGAHQPFKDQETAALERFVHRYNAIVFVDHTSNYSGDGAFLSTLATDNTRSSDEALKPDLIIMVGEISGDYPTANYLDSTNAVSWRVSRDGEIRDRFNTLTAVFECSEQFFFDRYADAMDDDSTDSYYRAWSARDLELRARIPELPFSGRWIAQTASSKVPVKSIMHFAILNALRSWNYFSYDKSVRGFCNTGGFGIDGPMSTLFGSALAEPSTVNYLITGDLAFFYDMNILGNRDLMKNIRILLVNNGLGDEMHMSYSIGSQLHDDEFKYVCADGHFRSHLDGMSAAGSWATAMGVSYSRAENKQQFMEQIDKFMDPNNEGPILLECVTTPDADVQAGTMLTQLDPNINREKKLKKAIKNIVPNSIIQKTKKMLSK